MPVASDHPGNGQSHLVIVPLAGRAGLRLAGEVDITNHDQLRGALAALPAGGVTAVHLDVSALCFIDVAGTRELVSLLRYDPRLRLILHDPPPCLRRIIALLWPGAANVEIRPGGPCRGWPANGQSDP